jgi:hypothetical protein
MMQNDHHHSEPEPQLLSATRDVDDDATEIRYRLTPLGEAALTEEGTRRGELFRGFGPCGAVA